MKSSFLILIICSSFLLVFGCATSQDLTRVDSRISNLERHNIEVERGRDQFQLRMEEFRKSQIEKEQQLRGQYAEIFATLDRMQEQIQSIGGKVELRDHQLKQLKSQSGMNGDAGTDGRMAALDQTANALKDRLQRIEEYLALDGSVKKAPSDKLQPKPDTLPAKELTESELYAKAKQDFDLGDLDTARAGFTDFLKRYPKSTVGDSAQFWIGEVYYRQKWYEKAILEYQKVIENYPKGNKVSAALLKQGFSFFNLGDKANARIVLKELINKFPASNEAKIAKQRIESS